MSNETKIGLLAIIAIALSIWGYKFVRGKNILVKSNIYFVEYTDVDQLKTSSPVLINGFQVGVVADIYLKPDKDSYNNPIQYTNNPLQSGYVSEENTELIKNSVPFKVKRMGKGRVILFTDNTNFRAF